MAIRAAVVGMGPVGLCCVQLLREAGVGVVVVDSVEAREMRSLVRLFKRLLVTTCFGGEVPAGRFDLVVRTPVVGVQGLVEARVKGGRVVGPEGLLDLMGEGNAFGPRLRVLLEYVRAHPEVAVAKDHGQLGNELLRFQRGAMGAGR